MLRSWCVPRWPTREQISSPTTPAGVNFRGMTLERANPPALVLAGNASRAAAAAQGLRSAAERAAAALGRFQAEALVREQAEEVLAVVREGLARLETAVALAASRPAKGEQESQIAARLASLDPAAVPHDLVDDALELLLSGLRAACLVNDLKHALPLGKAALALAEQHARATELARAHSDIATMYGRRDFNERAIEHLSAAIGVLEAAGEPVTPTLINNLGNVYVSNDRLDEALGCFERAASAYAEQGDEFREGIAVANQGRALIGQRRLREAAAALVQGLGIFRKLERRPYVAATLAKLGTCYSRLGEYEATITWFEAALAEIGEAGVGTMPFEDEVYEAYGRALLLMDRPEEALDYLERAAECANRDGVHPAAADMLKLQAEALAILGRYEDAYHRLIQYLEASAVLAGERGEALLGVMLVELESGLAPDHELPAITSRVLTEANRALRLQAEKLERISATDELTQQYNRRYLNQRLGEELRKIRGSDRPLSLILFDVDNFKSINDGYSHLIGDEVLRRVAATLRATFRRADVVARWGGEEFAVLLPDTAQAGALIVAEKARSAIAEFRWDEVATGLGVTVSAGIATASEVSDLDTVQGLLKLADRRLYQAKSAGRNRIASG